ncbi:hypothetical protein [Pararhizobium sp.]|uniref:hypothetical protein n=1 Tax=Pararhizobium sp. TaxID=1977563 RepID=UPI003BAAE141
MDWQLSSAQMAPFGRLLNGSDGSMRDQQNLKDFRSTGHGPQPHRIVAAADDGLAVMLEGCDKPLMTERIAGLKNGHPFLKQLLH